MPLRTSGISGIQAVFAAGVAAVVVVACGGASDGPGDPSVASSTLSADDPDGAAPAPSPAPPAGPACDTDDDCSAKGLCVHHVCREGCRSKYECDTGFCNFDNDNHCFNEHGCNPPPEGIFCPMICWGYCDTPQPRDAG